MSVERSHGALVLKQRKRHIQTSADPRRKRINDSGNGAILGGGSRKKLNTKEQEKAFGTFAKLFYLLNIKWQLGKNVSMGDGMFFVSILSCI